MGFRTHDEEVRVVPLQNGQDVHLGIIYLVETAILFIKEIANRFGN